jgi:glucose-1-phosphate thymidylyltransferase
MWGIIPAAGNGTRIQPLAFSKELLPVGSRNEDGNERPKAVGEYLVERMILAGARRICFVISPEKSDILEYFGGAFAEAQLCYVVQPKAEGLCDAIFRALPLIDDAEDVVIGLPDTVWFPEHAMTVLPPGQLSFLLFPVERPELFDAVVTDSRGGVQRIEVKDPKPSTTWVWGAFKLPGRILRELHALWLERERQDPYVGTLVNAWLSRGGSATAIRAGEAYVDVGTLGGYRAAMRLLGPTAPGDRGV